MLVRTGVATVIMSVVLAAGQFTPGDAAADTTGQPSVALADRIADQPELVRAIPGTSIASTQQDATADDQTQPDASARTLRTAPDGQVMITVRVGGDRASDASASLESRNHAQASGVAGVRLQLGGGQKRAATAKPGSEFKPYDFDWANCVSDELGDCTFIVPVKSSGATDEQGMNVDQRPWVGMSAEDSATPTGWHAPYTPILAATGASTTVDDSFTYLFRLDTEVAAGSKYVFTNGAEGSSFLKYPESNTDSVPGASALDSPPDSASGGRYMVVRDNPIVETEAYCAPNIAVVLNLSSSMTDADLAQAKSAVNGMVNGFAGTGAKLGIFSFNDVSPAIQADGSPATSHPGPYAVNGSEQAADFKSLYAHWTQPSSATADRHSVTNWGNALSAVADQAVDYDAVLLITDGAATNLTSNPNGAGGSSSTQYVDNVQALEAAVFSANSLKAKGTRVVPLYVGNGSGANTADELAVQNSLRNISGPVAGVDYFKLSQFRELAVPLNKFAATCGGALSTARINVDNRIQDADGSNERVASGWSIGAAVTATKGAVTASPAARVQVTPASGQVTWAATFGSAASRASVLVSETQEPYWSFVRGSCTITSAVGSSRTLVLRSASGVSVPDIAPGDRVECTFVNKPQTSGIDPGQAQADVKDTAVGQAPLGVGAAGAGVAGAKHAIGHLRAPNPSSAVLEGLDLNSDRQLVAAQRISNVQGNRVLLAGMASLLMAGAGGALLRSIGCRPGREVT